MGGMIELTTTDGATIGAYEAMPEEKPKGGIVVVQEIFGVNPHIRAVTDRFAAKGYAALAPALFDLGEEKGVELAYDAAGMKRGMAIASSIDRPRTIAAVEAAIARLAPAGRVGVVGFCLGGTLAFAAATREADLAAAVCYYGGGIAKMTESPLHCPVLMHFGEHDDHIPPEDVSAIREAYPNVPIHTYPAGHGFNCDARGSYDKDSADVAWTRTLDFLAGVMR